MFLSCKFNIFLTNYFKGQKINMFRKYLEWMPSRFKQAREEGLLDTPATQKELPEWFIEYKTNSDEYNSYHLNVFHDIKKNNNLNSGMVDNFRLVAYNNNYYTVNYGIHDSIILYLIENEGLDITEKQFEQWNRRAEGDIPFLCCQAEIPFLLLSESYVVINNVIEGPNFMQFQNVLKKTGLVFVDAKIWTAKSHVLKLEYLNNCHIQQRLVIENFRRTGNAVPKGKPFYISSPFIE